MDKKLYEDIQKLCVKYNITFANENDFSNFVKKCEKLKNNSKCEKY